MKEFPTFESKEKITREAVIDAYKPFVERGITNPDNLDLHDPAVQAANSLFDTWREQEDSRAQRDEEHERRNNLAKTMLYVDAGFTDPAYLEEVLHDWLAEDAQDAEKLAGNPARTETRRQIAEAMKKIRALVR